MSRIVFILLSLASLAVIVAPSGCVDNHAYRLGREAERRGYAHTAYEYYYRAATQQPGNPEIAGAIKRVAPTAATYWDAKSRSAAAEGRYGDAWCFTMRCLDILPSYPSALRLNLKLMTEHKKEIGPARYNWIRYGRRSLARAKPSDPRPDSASPTVTVALKDAVATDGEKHDAAPIAQARPDSHDQKEEKIALADPSPEVNAPRRPVGTRNQSNTTNADLKKTSLDRKQTKIETAPELDPKSPSTDDPGPKPEPIGPTVSTPAHGHTTPKVSAYWPFTDPNVTRPEPTASPFARPSAKAKPARARPEKSVPPVVAEKPERSAEPEPTILPEAKPKSKRAPVPVIAHKKQPPVSDAPKSGTSDPEPPPLQVARATPRSLLPPNPLDRHPVEAESTRANRSRKEPLEIEKPKPAPKAKPRPEAKRAVSPKSKQGASLIPESKAEPIAKAGTPKLSPPDQGIPKHPSVPLKSPTPKESTPKTRTAIDTPVVVARPKASKPAQRVPIQKAPVEQGRKKPVEGIKKTPASSLPPLPKPKRKPMAKKDVPVSPQQSMPEKKRPAPKKIQRAPSKEKPRKSKPKAVPEEAKYLQLCTLSKGDRRYKPQAEVVEELFLLLRDTDDELDADIDLYEGGHRLLKIRDLKTGRSKMFRGRSGRWYRLTILDIQHRSHTVRLGINPA
ncbi:MAG: hypothetical protein ACE5EQ_09260 [Phycisphaerae bacterium]